MICTVEDFKKRYSTDKTDEEIAAAIELASEYIKKVTGKTFDEPLPFSHPLNLVCCKIAYYELFPEKKERLGVVEERIEGYSYSKGKWPVIYGDPEIDRILALYIEGVRMSAG